MKLCDRNLARIIYDNSEIINKEGLDIIIKGIPDSDKKGVFDKREYDIRSAIAKFRKNIPLKFDFDSWRRTTRSYCMNLNDSDVTESEIEIECNGKKIKVLVSEPAVRTKQARPAFVYIHGGSFMTSSAGYYRMPCNYITEKANCVSFNIEYSLAPENKYPVAIEECVALLEFINENADKYNIDRTKVAISGDSAGGNLAIAACIRCRKEVRPFYAALFYPCVDLYGRENLYPWSEDEYEIDDSERELIVSRLVLGRPDGKGEDKLMDFVFRGYIGEQYDRLKKEPDISPVYADLSEMPKTDIFTAEFDALRIQDEYYAKRLKSYKREVRIIRYRGVSHAFLDYFGSLPQAEAAVMEICAKLGE